MKGRERPVCQRRSITCDLGHIVQLEDELEEIRADHKGVLCAKFVVMKTQAQAGE